MINDLGTTVVNLVSAVADEKPEPPSGTFRLASA